MNIIKINKENIKFFLKEQERFATLLKIFVNIISYIITKDRQIGNLVSKYKIDSIIASTSSGLLGVYFMN